jgi:hypothetical protein
MSTQEQQKSSGAPETGTPNKDEGAAPSSLRELAKSFSLDKGGKPQPKVETGESHAEGDDKKPPAKSKPKDLKTLAETLGVEVKDLYDIAIPSGRDGEEPTTLGKLKDHFAEREDFTVRSLAFDEEKRRKEADFLRAEQELQVLLSALPKDAIKPETLKAAREKQANHMKAERARALDTIPEWKDEKVREADLTEIVEHLSSYGLSAAYLASVYDHRTMKLLRDFTKQTRRLKAALELASERTPKTQGKSKSGQPSGKPVPAKPRGRVEQQMQRLLSAINS